MMNQEIQIELESTLYERGILLIYKELLYQYPQFTRWTGTINPKSNHYGEGGLVKHTYEVIRLGINIIKNLETCKDVDETEYCLAALFHDTKKIFEYKPVCENRYDEWMDLSLKYDNISHSILVWHNTITHSPKFYDRYYNSVIRDILVSYEYKKINKTTFINENDKIAQIIQLCDLTSELLSIK